MRKCPAIARGGWAPLELIDALPRGWPCHVLCVALAKNWIKHGGSIKKTSQSSPTPSIFSLTPVFYGCQLTSHLTLPKEHGFRSSLKCDHLCMKWGMCTLYTRLGMFVYKIFFLYYKIQNNRLNYTPLQDARSTGKTTHSMSKVSLFSYNIF